MNFYLVVQWGKPYIFLLLHIRINIEHAMLLMILVYILQVEVRNVGYKKAIAVLLFNLEQRSLPDGFGLDSED